MNVGLLSYHFSDNYGALYQAYALRKWFLGRGIGAEFINYAPPYVDEGGPFDCPWRPSLWRKNATILYMKLAYLQGRLFGNHELLADFDRFRAEHLGICSPRLKTAKALRPYMAAYDMLVCGSDQIWNPSIQRGLDPVYFLDISGAEKARKVAYAPSFGRSAIEQAHLAEIGRLVIGLDAISVRETSGLDILESAGLPRDRAQVVPDPTILLGRFDELLARNVEPDDSIFCYALRTATWIREVAEMTATHVGGPLLTPRSSRQRWRDIGKGVVPGPVEWLQMLARAQLVVSNSFHGITLSVVLNRPFIAVALPGKRVDLNARARHLLYQIGLADRIMDVPDIKTVRQLIATPVNWEAVNAMLAAIRAEAEAYLDAEIEAARAQVK
ncbi:MAG: polysaccharide pyruvyl transferase family protein [Chromatiaceae bacterium]|nr:polysaccharide pyruvyl transferase family protein [Chromatiaceae bacterium]MCF8002790.1 polysaccharide pyruvyl transferase family protein [Chromatiaceae bacterium]